MINSAQARMTSVSALILVAAPALADSTGFTGFYAPYTWTITGAGLGGSSATFAPDGSELELIGSDGGIGSTINVTHLIMEDGMWSFHWSWVIPDGSPVADIAYYTINGQKTFLSFSSFDPGGTITVPVTAGQTIGWQVVSVDGIFGAGNLTITDFRAPVPTPATLALLGIGTIARAAVVAERNHVEVKTS